jgi:hypothetical protein
MRYWLALVLLFTAGSSLGDERKLEAGFQLALDDLDELDSKDVGFGGRFAFRPAALFALEGELNFFPKDLPADVPVTSSRLEGLFGVKAGPRFERVGLFAKVRPGFVRFGEAPGPVACILIYPPPLRCVLAQGETVFALDLGGGVEIFPSERSVLRFDVSSLLLRYPGPAFTRAGEAIQTDGFWGGNFRLTFGAGFRF